MAKKSKSIKADLCASNLKLVLKYRKLSVAELADDLNMKPRSIAAYISGEVSIEDAKAKTVMTIAKYLDVDPYILVGMRPVDDFFKAAENRTELAKRLTTVEPWRRKRRYSSSYLDTEADKQKTQK